MMALLASSILLASQPVAAAPELLSGQSAIAEGAAPREFVEACRRMIPEDVELSGRIVLRNRKGIALAEHEYVLTRNKGAMSLKVDGVGMEKLASITEGTPQTIMGTDVTWSDLTLEYLWWDDFAFDAEREAESVHGQMCTVVIMRNGERAVRVWIDRKTGALMQAEELKNGKSVRRLWGTRIKKFGERWAPKVMEVETFGSGHRTKIVVEEIK